MKHPLLIGIDAGGTKTECIAYRLSDGRVARTLGPGSNYCSTGIAAATNTWQHLIELCCEQLSATSPHDVAGAGLGIAGLDRPKDAVTIGEAFDCILTHGPPRTLVNDADLVLRAGAPGGIGVAVISGTGCNAMGVAPGGRRFRVGGIGPEFGDLGSAWDIGTEALKAAFRSQDGRGDPTAIVPMLMQRLKLERLDDLVDFFLVDSEESGDGGEDFNLGQLAPLVFEAAANDDAVSIKILEWAGRELALSARAVARQLFAPGDPFPLVMGGSVLQKGTTDHLQSALIRDVRTEFSEIAPVVLSDPPSHGALLLALDSVAQQSATTAWPGQDEVLACLRGTP